VQVELHINAARPLDDGIVSNGILKRCRDTICFLLACQRTERVSSPGIMTSRWNDRQRNWMPGRAFHGGEPHHAQIGVRAAHSRPEVDWGVDHVEASYGELTCTGGIHNGYAAIASVVGTVSAMSA